MKEIYLALKKERSEMVSYLKLKTEKEDWHGVADAAMDIREIDARLAMLTQIMETFPQPC